MGVKMKKQEMRAAMKDNFLMPDSASDEWRAAPLNSKVVFMSFWPQIQNARPRELRPDVPHDLPNRLKVRKALVDLVDRGLIVRTLTRPDRYALNFPPYSEYPHY